MKKIILSLVIAVIAVFNVAAQAKYVTRTGQAIIYSHTVAEDITATNNTVTGIISVSTGEVAISVPVQSFQFAKALMQEHFNSSNFLDSKQFPRITLKGKITNFSAIDLSKNKKYEVSVEGELTIKGTTKPVTENATLEIENGKANVSTKFIVKDIGSYGVGKPKGSKKNNVADDITVTYTALYEKE
ncbi:protein YceI [mine drainage metagenome]|uniref:Protein YceI n=1 Tax=mine drainage metagenome TaxID=410659 RepID=A0A1J5SBC0_9ZZZZ